MANWKFKQIPKIGIFAACGLLSAGSALALTTSVSSLTLVQGGSTAVITVSGALGTVSATSADASTRTDGNPAILDVTASTPSSVTVAARTAGYTMLTVKDSLSKVIIPVTVVTPAGASTNRYSLFAWNDLGMHCMDGKDYSVFSILPPFNNLNAQLVDRSVWTGPVRPAKLTGHTLLTGVTLSYQSVTDGLLNTINTYSGGISDVRKTNFWQYVKGLYGSQPADNCGLTGYKTPGATAANMAFNGSWNWFEAPGLPITPLSESVANSATLVRNEYPPVKVIAKDAKGVVLASTVTVLPVSDEITCKGCHASSSPDSQSTRTDLAGKLAKPDSGWVYNLDAEKDWKLNILKRHDELRGTTLYTSATQNPPKPVLCAGCHGSNALNLAPNGAQQWLTSALHSNHAYVTDPSSGNQTLNASTNRNSCYSCHPGSSTQCLRGAMSHVSGVECQSCHGSMGNVGNPARVGWMEQPTCQACHNSGKRLTSAVDGNGNLLTTTDTQFATNPNTPASWVAGKSFSLYRFSTGHGKMKCESCHGATHAEYPSTQPNDNLQSISLQGYKGTVLECIVCHKSPPQDNQLNLGPHGMHWVGPTWVAKHNDFGKKVPATCQSCHGADYRGTPLSQVKAPRTFKSKNGAPKSYYLSADPKTSTVGCYDCHNWPKP